MNKEVSGIIESKEDRLKVRLDRLPDHFPSNIREGLQGAVTHALSDEEVFQHAEGLRMGPANFLVPKGNIVSLIEDNLPEGTDSSFLTEEPMYIFFCGDCCTKI